MPRQTDGRDAFRRNGSHLQTACNRSPRIGPKLGHGAFHHTGRGLQRRAVHPVPRDLTTCQIEQHRLDDGIADVDAQKQVRRHGCKPPMRRRRLPPDG